MIVAGVLVFAFSGPKKGSIECQKRRYLLAYKGLNRETLYERLRDASYEAMGKTAQPGRDEQLDSQFRSSKRALISLGFLCERIIFLTNHAGDEVIARLPKVSEKHAPFTHMTPGTTLGQHAIFTTAPKEDLGKWEELIRKADGPQIGN